MILMSGKFRRDIFRRGFTMIELILVMALLAIAISYAAPALSNFFHGRALHSEAVRLLSLAHAGQSRAVSEAMPMLLWVDVGLAAYGLQIETSSRTGNYVDPKAQEFNTDSTVKLEALDTAPMPVGGKNLPAIRFLPDGSLDERSPRVLKLGCTDGSALWLVQSANRLTYEIKDTDR